MREEPLGHLDSWLRDGIVGGGLMPPAAVLGGMSAAALLDGQFPQALLHPAILFLVIVTGVMGSLLGVGVGPLAGLLASWTWRVPLITLSLGPLLGLTCAWTAVTVLGVFTVSHRPPLSATHWALFLGFGAFALGPPWVAYVGVRAKGRSGLPVVLATALWVGLLGAFVVIAEELRRR